MIRFIIYLVIGYVVWKVVQLFTATQRRPQPPSQKPPTSPAPPRTFKNVKDAEFEDVSDGP